MYVSYRVKEVNKQLCVFLFSIYVELLTYLRSLYHPSSHDSVSGLKRVQLTFVKTPNIGHRFISWKLCSIKSEGCEKIGNARKTFLDC